MTAFPSSEDFAAGVQKKPDITIASTVFAAADLASLQGVGDWAFAQNLDGDAFFTVALNVGGTLTKFTIAGSVVS